MKILNIEILSCMNYSRYSFQLERNFKTLQFYMFLNLDRKGPLFNPWYQDLAQS